MNASTLFNNDTLLTTIVTTSRTIKQTYITNPFDSWYIGGVTFMVIVVLVLFYANFYREHCFQLLWTQFLFKLHLIEPPSTAASSPMPINTL
ncbi:unnamed protein product [Rotaria magnacalcarata]|uniref:Uncharacterized protein n=1 Tax=Rotaria magnacalcarata TaxID=392030 RepID=A0A816A5L6_9BILA|nr:unnamed protein product [Rotaria magnacalcarata]CAF1957244.1 unnamed protein product [Rotaria magnacalcarata]CAF2140775.1 unnamed protein product [Rotaria magnacalcarata]CAF2209262.1 unnamed protein product [Rotaria magnacalcarata]CAF3982297.1 unnamed protein product [Rotaria magnacalcarata]